MIEEFIFDGLGFSSVFFFQAEDGIRDVLGSRGLGDVYKRQTLTTRVSREEKKGLSSHP